MKISDANKASSRPGISLVFFIPVDWVTQGPPELVEPYEPQEGLIEGCYTHNKRPVELMPVGEFRDLVEAISMEKQIKGWSRQKKKALIAGNYQKLVELAKSHPSTSSG